MSFTSLGEYVPQTARTRRSVPYAHRVNHVARHGASPRKGLRQWAVSLLRELGDQLVSAFDYALTA